MFSERKASIAIKDKLFTEKTIDLLAKESKTPYHDSIPLIASAELRDKPRYEAARNQMLLSLSDLNKNPTQFPEWMRGKAFQAWMQGRILSSAILMKDKYWTDNAKQKLTALLEDKTTPQDAFSAWGWGYLAAVDKTYVGQMMKAAEALSKNAKKPSDVADALWAWTMNIVAASNAGDEKTYQEIKNQIKSLTNADTVVQALEKNLIRGDSNNDYPAWALAKVYAAAKKMNDVDLCNEMEPVITASIQGARDKKQDAEYILALLEKPTPIKPEKVLTSSPRPSMT